MSQTPVQPPIAPSGSRALWRGAWSLRRIAALTLSLLGGLMAVGCFQELDTGAFGGPAASDSTRLNLPCKTGSQECFDLCGSPDCALGDAAIWQNFQTPVIYEADGATTTVSCDQVEAESLAIRARSCEPCHTGPRAQDNFSYIMDDSKLSTMLSNNFNDTDGGPFRMVVPGDTHDSWVYQRMILGLTKKASGMPPPDPTQILGTTAGAAIVRPTPADLTVMYQWITQCLVDAGGAAPNYAQGPGYGPTAGSGPSDAGAGGQ